MTTYIHLIFFTFIVSATKSSVKETTTKHTPKQTPKGRKGRAKFEPNPDCSCTDCAQNANLQLPWMPSTPRFTVADHHATPNTTTKTNQNDNTSQIEQGTVPRAKPVPGLLSIGNRNGSENGHDASLANQSVDAEMMEAQFKLNAEMMARVEALEADKKKHVDEKKALEDERNQLKMLIEQANKEKQFFKSRLADTTDQLQYLKKRMMGKSSEQRNEQSAAYQSTDNNNPESNVVANE